MCSALTPQSRYDISINKLLWNMFCPNTMCSNVLCLHKKIFQSLSRSDYQGLQCGSICQVVSCAMFFSKKHQNQFSLKFGLGIYFFEETKKSIQSVVGDVYCPTCQDEKCVFLQLTKFLVHTTVKSAEPALTC